MRDAIRAHHEARIAEIQQWADMAEAAGDLPRKRRHLDHVARLKAMPYPWERESHAAWPALVPSGIPRSVRAHLVEDLRRGLDDFAYLRKVAAHIVGVEGRLVGGRVLRLVSTPSKTIKRSEDAGEGRIELGGDGVQHRDVATPTGSA
jgi:hypothetical protein